LNREFEERARTALNALSAIAKAVKQVIFLGGSAIQVIIPKPRRLSIDLDVSYSGEASLLVDALEKAGFTVLPRQSRDTNFVFYTVSKNEARVKLDVSRFAVQEQDVVKTRVSDFEVFIPKPRYFLAAKLSSLAFGTVGRFEEEPTQVIKDVFDINCLLDAYAGLEGLRGSWQQIIREQNRLRKKSFSEAQCVESVGKTLLKCAEVSAPEQSAFYVPQPALGNFGEYLLSGGVSRSEFAAMSARALLLSADLGARFREIEEKILADCTNRAALDDAEAVVSGESGLSHAQANALKIIAPKALLYVKHWLDCRKKRGSVIARTRGARNPRHS